MKNQILKNKYCTYRPLGVSVESVSYDQAVEGARAGGEAGGDHVVNDIRDSIGVAIASPDHELLHESQAEVLLGYGGGRGRRRGVVVVALGLPPLPSNSLLGGGDRRGAYDEGNGVVGAFEVAG